MKFHLSNDAYDRLRGFVQILLPAVSALYVALAAIWGFGYSVQVAGSAAALGTFLGIALKISRSTYAEKGYDGAFVVNEVDPDTDTFTLRPHAPFDELKNQKTITLAVQNAQ